MKQLHCEKCGGLLATLRDASVRKDLIALCRNCYRPKPKEQPHDVPDFLRGLFR